MKKLIYSGKIFPLLKEQKGRFFSISFIKKNGKVRNLTGRLGVKSHRKTNSRKSSASRFDNPYILVFDVQKQGYRMVNMNTAIEIKADKQTFKVVK
jgi:hypothetical protein